MNVKLIVLISVILLLLAGALLYYYKWQHSGKGKGKDKLTQVTLVAKKSGSGNQSKSGSGSGNQTGNQTFYIQSKDGLYLSQPMPFQSNDAVLVSDIRQATAFTLDTASAVFSPPISIKQSVYQLRLNVDSDNNDQTLYTLDSQNRYVMVYLEFSRIDLGMPFQTFDDLRPYTWDPSAQIRLIAE